MFPLIGALVMASLDNGMSMLDVDTYWQMIVNGFILTLAVWADVATRVSRREKSVANSFGDRPPNKNIFVRWSVPEGV